MSAVLKPIERAIVRPRFDNASVNTFGVWQAANGAALKAYYAELGRTLPQSDEDNLTGQARAQAFIAFCKCQWDHERGAF